MNGRDERLMQLRVGFMVLGMLLITAILIVMFGELPDLIHGEYTIYVTFDKAPGVAEDTPVHKSGILIACEFPNFPDMQRLPKWSGGSPYEMRTCPSTPK